MTRHPGIPAATELINGRSPRQNLRSAKFCIVGAGAVGGMLATLLACAGATVSLLARGETLAAINRHGLRLMLGGHVEKAVVRASDEASDLGVQDYVIIAVKAPSLPDVAQRIDPLLGPKTAVITAMNGVPWWFLLNARGELAGERVNAIDPDGTISEAISISPVIGCVVYAAVSADRPGIIRHHSGLRLVVGEPANRLTPRLASLANWLRRAGFECRESVNIRREIWFKLLGNLSMNPISLLTTATSDRIIGDPLVRRLCISMMEEAAQIGAALGLQADASIEKMLEMIRALGSFKMSMLQDLERNKPVELDVILTVTHELGLQMGVPTPSIDSVLGLARLRARTLNSATEVDNRAKGKFEPQYTA
jgi:2-dehydropantoate 2-reductase